MEIGGIIHSIYGKIYGKLDKQILGYNFIALILLLFIIVVVSPLGPMGFAESSSDTGCANDQSTSFMIYIRGRVIRYSITSSLVEEIRPKQTLWILMIELESVTDSNQNKLSEGDVITVYSEEELSARLYEEEVKATVKRENDKHWLVNLFPQPPADLPLASKLYDLTFTENPKQYARREDIQLKNDKVKVIVELESPNIQFSSGLDLMVESRSKNLARVWVAIEHLIPLAKKKGVGFVRTPHEPDPQAH